MMESKYIKILRKIVDYEEKHKEEFERREEQWKKEGYDFKDGWSWSDVGVSPQRLHKLVTGGFLEIVYKSNKKTLYRLRDFNEAKAIVEDYKKQIESRFSGPGNIPSDLFDTIEGYEDVKELMWMAIKSDKQVHMLLVGPPATAKSLFLLELSRLPNAYYAVGSRTSGAGLSEVLFDLKPSYLLIDEIEKIAMHSKSDLSVLLSLMETGIVKDTKANSLREVRLNTKVFAAANDDKRLPPELKSRFGAFIFYFKEYGEDEYINIVENYLTKREGTSREVAKYIAEKTKGSRDVRVARSIARLAKTKDDVDRVVSVVRKYALW